MAQGEQPWLLFRCWTKSHWKPVFIFLPKEDLACRIVHKTWGLFPPFPCDNFWFGQKTAKAFVRDRATGNDNTREYSAGTDSDSSNRQTDRPKKWGSYLTIISSEAFDFLWRKDVNLSIRVQRRPGNLWGIGRKHSQFLFCSQILSSIFLHLFSFRPKRFLSSLRSACLSSCLSEDWLFH